MIGECGMRENWLVEGKDVFANEWYEIGRFDTRDEAIAAARKSFLRLQPPPGTRDWSGGPHPPGIQDRIFIVPPEGEGDGWQYVGEE